MDQVQTEEEAALGRGKRQRKAVSYREAYAPQLGETLNESCPQEEPELEYTPAGKALKVKLDILAKATEWQHVVRNKEKPSRNTLKLIRWLPPIGDVKVKNDEALKRDFGHSTAGARGSNRR